MSALVTLESFSLAPQGPTISVRLGGGESLATMGPPGSGKSRWFDVLQGRGHPGQGSCKAGGEIVVVAPGELSQKATPYKVAMSAAGRAASPVMADALYACQLHDQHKTPIGSLTHAKQAAAALLPCLASSAPILILDSVLDPLDPWTLDRVFTLLSKKMQMGCCILAATHRQDIAIRFDRLLVFDRGTPRFLGPPLDFIERRSQAKFRVRSEGQKSVEAWIAPFQVEVEATEEGVLYRAPGGQKTAAELLTLGYGDVEWVCVEQPTLEEALRTLLR